MAQAEHTDRFYRTSHYRSGKSPKLHTDPDCRILKKTETYREVTRQQFPNADVYKYCSGERKDNAKPDRSAYQALLEAGNGSD